MDAYLKLADRAKVVALVDIVPGKAKSFMEEFNIECDVYENHEDILDRNDIDLVDVCTPPYVHASISINCLKSGKNVVCEKPMAASLEECDAMLKARDESGKKLSIIAQNRFRKPIRDLKMLLDSGLAGEEDATVQSARIANYDHPDYPELEDFGDCTITGKNGTTNYFRVDWFNPDGLRTWGDGRTFILGTEGYIEIRKYINVGTDKVDGNHVFLVNGKGEKYVNATGVTGYPFFGQLILDCLNRTENAMTQAHAFKAAELCLQAQLQAQRLKQYKKELRFCEALSFIRSCDLGLIVLLF